MVSAALTPVIAAPPVSAATTITRLASSSSGSSSSRTSITLNRPSGTAAGQVMVASIVSNDDIPAFTAPAGWSLVRTDETPGVQQSVYVKVAGASEPSSYTWGLADWRRVAGGITTYTGVDTTQPVAAAAGAADPGNGTAVTAPSITTGVANTLLVHFAAIGAEGTLSPPGAMTERWEAASPNTRNDRDVLASASDGPLAAAGASGPRTAGASQAGPRVAALLALRPGGSPPDDGDPEPPGGDPVLVGAGDIAACGSVNGDEKTAALLDGIPGTVFTVGDNAYEDGTDHQFANCYGPTWGRHKARTLPAAGNHEYQTPGASGYFDYFGAAAGDPDKGWYDTTVGSWHVIVLNSNCAQVGGCGANSAQVQWLRSVLAASDAACTVALWHHPRFSSAISDGSKPTYQPFWQALYDFGADVVLVGHDHVYERFALQTPTGEADPDFGLRQFTVGTGGRSHSSFATTLPNSERRNRDTFGVLALTLHANSYDWEFVPEAGRSFTDSGTAACHGAPGATTPPPPPPTDGPITPVASTSSGSSSSRSSITLSRPAGTVAGHVMVAQIVSNDDNPGFAAPAGWTLVSDRSIADALRQAVYVTVAGSSEPSSYTWDLGAYRRVAGGITAYSGVATTGPVDTSTTAVNTSASTAVAAPSISTTVPGTRLVHLAAINATGTLSPPGGMTERWEAAAPNNSNDRDALASASDAPFAGSGATGSRSATATQAGRSIATLLALHPAGPPPPPDTDPPQTAIDTGPSGTVASSVATFTFSADEPATFSCRLDDGEPAGCSSPVTYTGLGNGEHTFTVTATDTAGNADGSPASRPWTVDVPPVEEDVIDTIAGTGTKGFSGDGGPATAARLAAPRTMATDSDGNLFVVDTENHRVRRIDATTGVITTVAGTGTAGYNGDGIPALSAQLDNPHGIDVDSAGNIYVADPPNQRIRRIDATTGVITTVAGTGTRGYNGDNIPATSARLNYPKGVTVAPDGSLYIGDADNERVRRVDPATGLITTVAGNGTTGYSGDGGPATGARLHRPRNVAFDDAGNLYIADQENTVVRRVSPSGTITTFAGTGIAGFSGDGGPATAAQLRLVRDVAVDAAGNVYIADELNDRVRVVTPDGIIHTLAGTGSGGFSGDGGPPAEARLNGPRGVYVDPAGRILVADTFNHRIRRITRS